MLKNIFGSDLSRNLFRLVLWGAGLASISMIVWTLGPLVDIGGYRPLQNTLVRQAVILIIAAAVAGGLGLHFHKRRLGQTKAVSDTHKHHITDVMPFSHRG